MRQSGYRTYTFQECFIKGRYYDPVKKKEGNGLMPVGCIPIDPSEKIIVTKRYKISVEDIKKYGELLPDVVEESASEE